MKTPAYFALTVVVFFASAAACLSGDDKRFQDDVQIAIESFKHADSEIKTLC